MSRSFETRSGDSPMMRHIRAKHHREQLPKTVATVLAIAASIGLAALGAYAHTKGFNKEPRGPKGLIVLNDPEAERRVSCLRDLFNDAVHKRFTRNRWADENCPPELVEQILNSDNPLHDSKTLRDAAFTSVGVEPATETWTKISAGSDGQPQMKIEVDLEKARQAIKAGTILAPDQESLARSAE